MYVRLLFILGLLISCGKAPAPEESEGGYILSNPLLSGSIYGYWKSSDLPLYIRFSSSFSSSEITALKSSSEILNSQANTIDLFDYASSTFSPPDFGSLSHCFLSTTTMEEAVTCFNGRFEIQRVYDDLFPSNVIALTVFSGIEMNPGTTESIYEIKEADIYFNDFDYNFSTSPSISTFHLQSVMIHEMGHLIGFGHYTASNSIMNKTLDYNQSKTTLFDIDKIMIDANYGLNGNARKADNSASFAALALRAEEEKNIFGRIEVRDNSLCQHYINNKLIFEHHWTNSL